MSIAAPVSVPLECEPWRAVVEEVLREAEDPVWDTAVPAPSDASSGDAPLLAGAEVVLPRGALARVWRRCLDAANRCGPRIAEVASWLDDEKYGRLWEASLDGDDASIEIMAERGGVDVEAAESLAHLLPVPFLQACHRQLATHLRPGWSRAFCPLCGSWPAFAEMRGIERTRGLRCGRCGAAWYAPPLSCGFCGTQDHTDLVALVPADRLVPPKADTRQPEGSAPFDEGVVDACTRCGAYVKRFTTLEGWPPGAVMLQDLASVSLDLAAIEEGYARPSGTGQALRATLRER